LIYSTVLEESIEDSILEKNTKNFGNKTDSLEREADMTVYIDEQGSL
jgi:hypothetical protein